MASVSKHRAVRRQVRPRRRVTVLTLALGATIVVGGTAVGVLPQLNAGSATADTGASVAPIVSAPAPVAPPAPVVADAVAAVAPSLPADSGEGRRIVFSESDQRVWLVTDDESIERTYLVSGSRFDNLEPGTYAVQSKTRQATAFDYSGTMEYFVRFATGVSEPIGFHSVPRDNAGDLEQTKAQLGTPLSAGCVRQWQPDAIALWAFAPIGTTVVVTP